jgi:hypothetical protein
MANLLLRHCSNIYKLYTNLFFYDPFQSVITILESNYYLTLYNTTWKDSNVETVLASEMGLTRLSASVVTVNICIETEYSS